MFPESVDCERRQSEMDETPAAALENRSGDVVCVTTKLLDLEILEQLGNVTASGCNAECVETPSNEEKSAENDLGFRVEQQQQDFDAVEEMGRDFLGELPEHLTENILARLSVISILRLRSVCKRWNAVTSNPGFLETHARAKTSWSPSPPIFLLYADQARQSYPVYDPAENIWHLLPEALNSSPPGNSRSTFVILAAAGGLLCLMDTLSDPEEGRLNLYVSNPITKAQRGLPPTIWMPLSKPYVVGMAVDNTTNTYKILVAQNGHNLKLQVYDSASDSWQMTGSVLRRLALIVGTAYTKGILYCLAYGAVTSVSAYDMDRGVLEDVPVRMPAFLARPQLFVSRGHLMMVGAISLCGMMRSTCVWQMDTVQMEWVEVLRVPAGLLPGLSRGGDSGIHNVFIADGDHICFVSYRVKKMLMCNVAEKSCWWLPVCPFDTGDDAPNLSGFPLQPSLVASV